MQNLTHIEVNSQIQNTACVILMHGLGDSAAGLKPLVDALDMPQDSKIKFILPDAPMRPITVNQGMTMRGWYDITGMNITSASDLNSILISEQQICDLIQSQIDAGIPSQRIILAGFSQGGVMALHVGLRFNQPLGGILAMSSYLPLFNQLPEGCKAHQKSVPIQVQHGLHDVVVPVEAGKMSYSLLKEKNYNVSWSEYPVEHSIDFAQVVEIKHWLLKHLS